MRAVQVDLAPEAVDFQAQAGLQQHENLTLHKIDPDQNPGSGTLRSARCKILHGTVYLPGAIHDIDPVMVTRDCDVIEGNSGSPLVTDSGTLAAIAFASIVHDPISEKINLTNGNVFEALAEKAEMARVTNLACLSLPPPAAAVSTACTAAAAATAKTAKDGVIATPALLNLDPQATWPAIKAAVKTASLAHKDMLDDKFRYSPSVSIDNAAIELNAVCFNAPLSWLTLYQPTATPVTSANFKSVRMTWSLSWTLDDDLKAIPQLTEIKDPELIELQFNPAALKQTGQSDVKDLTAGSDSTWKTCAKSTH